jgi:FKBP-type peptidyl-prolyl cis-trans isomerase
MNRLYPVTIPGDSGDMPTRLTFVIPVLVCFGCVAGRDDFPARQSESNDSPAIAETEPTPQPATRAAEDDADKPPFESTGSGLKYRILEPGDGKQPEVTSTVVCHYRGWLDNGQEFDSSYQRGEPATFPLNGVIPGWTEGLQLVKEGGKLELEIPSELGYGASGAPPVIPPNATLHFEIELISVR